MSLEFDRHALVSIFTAEASDGLAKLSSVLTPADASVATIPTPEALHQLYIVAHSLKGAAALYGYERASSLAEILEKALEQACRRPDQEWPSLVPIAREIVARLLRQIDIIQESGTEESDGGNGPPSLSEQDSQIADGENPIPDAYLLPDLDAEVYSYFVPEAQEYLEIITSSLLKLEKRPDGLEDLEGLFRAAHTLKGSAYTVGFQAIGDLTHEVEDIVEALRERRMELSADLMDQVLHAMDVVRIVLIRDPARLERTRTEFQTALRELRQAGPHRTAAPASAILSPQQESEPPTHPARQEPARSGERIVSGEQAVIRVRRNRLERLLNLVGELVIDRSRLERRLTLLEELSRQVSLYETKMLSSVRAFEEKHSFSIGESATTNAGIASPSLIEEFGALEFDKYDDFNVLARSMGEVSADIAESMGQLSALIRLGRDDMRQLQRLTLSLRDEIAQARMVPLGTLFTRFQKAVREMGRASGKIVELTTAGGEIELDTEVVQRLVDPLIHIIRNAVHHGIETPAARQASGKPPTGSVAIRAAQSGAGVTIEVHDDGGGLDLEKIKAKAMAMGALTSVEVEAITSEKTINLIYLPGCSTADEISAHAGRGVGMDVVKRAVEALNGQIDVVSQEGSGTRFTLRIPLTLLITTALVARLGEQRYALPLSAVREVLGPAVNLVRHTGGASILQNGDERIEVRSLPEILGDRPEGVLHASPLVVLHAGHTIMAVAVDELLGRQEIVIKTLGPLKIFKQCCYSGAAVDPDGRVLPVLDVPRLLSQHQRTRVPAAVAAQGAIARGFQEDHPSKRAEPARLRILLIDDSLSVRKFISRMLEKAGYLVATAVDGEDGLRKAGTEPYQLIITDLEMPKINGYEVIRSLKESAHTHSLPIVVMTTRAGEKHRQMAMNLGATAYVVKPVDERMLIEAVRSLIGDAAAVNLPALQG
jgi:chemosensory pili system protein ChpA (sensor histidine kinase/response regulator)